MIWPYISAALNLAFSVWLLLRWRETERAGTPRTMRPVVTKMRQVPGGDWVATVRIQPGEEREARGSCTVWAWRDTGRDISGDIRDDLLAAWKLAKWSGCGAWNLAPESDT